MEGYFTVKKLIKNAVCICYYNNLCADTKHLCWRSNSIKSKWQAPLAMSSDSQTVSTFQWIYSLFNTEMSREQIFSSDCNIKNHIIYLLDNDLMDKKQHAFFFMKLMEYISNRKTTHINIFRMSRHIVEKFKYAPITRSFLEIHDKFKKQQIDLTYCKLCGLQLEFVEPTHKQCDCHKINEQITDDDCYDEFALDMFLTVENVRCFIICLFKETYVHEFVCNIIEIIHRYVMNKVSTPFYEHFISDITYHYPCNFYIIKCRQILLHFSLFQQIIQTVKNRKYLVYLFHEESCENYYHKIIAHRVFADCYIAKNIVKFL